MIETEQGAYRWSLASQHDRFCAFDDLYQLLADATPAVQKRILAQIVARCGPGEERDSHGTLSVQELRELAAGGLITIGGYTHQGAKLSRLSEPEQRKEVEYNQHVLEEILGQRLEYFAYPYGNEESYTPATRRILQDCGFRLACRVACDTVRLTGTDHPYELPRREIRDWNPYTFHRYLEAVFA